MRRAEAHAQPVCRATGGPLRWSLEHPTLLVGWILAEGVSVGPSPPALSAALDRAIATAAAGGLPQTTRRLVREVLRRFGYQPSGRGKPASEFLARAAERGNFPRINNAVDVNNLVSLETGLPGTLLDLDRACPGGERLEVRVGRPGERYVFNPAGQEIDLAGLIVVARVGGAALGNPVKDSMTTRIREDTRRVLGVLYSSSDLHSPAEMEAVARRFADRLARYAGATTTATGVLCRTPSP